MRYTTLLLILSLTVGCGSPRGEGNSEIYGFGGVIKRVWPEIADLDQPKLGLFIRRIHETGQRAITAGGVVSALSSREALAAGYVKAVHELDGVPRHQGEEVLRSVVAKDATACGGASCAKVFGVEPGTVDAFMDGMLVQTGLSPTLLKVENEAFRKRILTSLRPRQEQSFEDAFGQTLAEISATIPVKLPKRVAEPATILPRFKYHQLGGDTFVQAVYDYSGMEYTHIRFAEAGEYERLQKLGLSDGKIDALKVKVTEINTGLTKFPKVKDTVYRGMKDVSREQIQKWRTLWEKDQPMGLGIGDKPGLASASWDPEVAKKFMGTGNIFGFKKTYGVIFELTNHQGVSIQTISKVLSEKEVLIPSHMRFKIEQMSLLDHGQGMLHIKLRGVDSAYRLRLASRCRLMAA